MSASESGDPNDPAENGRLANRVPSGGTVRIAGQYFDGTSTRAQEVTALLDPRGGIWFDPGGLERGWHVEPSAIRVMDRLEGIPRKLQLPAGALFETRADDAVDDWCRQARGQRSQGILSYLERDLVFVLAALVFVIGSVWIGYRYGIPAVSRMVASALPDVVVEEIDDSTLAFLDGSFFSESHLSEEQRQEVRYALSDLQPPIGIRLQFRSFYGIPNAFALPNGTIIVTDALVELLPYKEMRGVLAHELAHVDQRHGLQMIVRASAIPALMAFLTGDLGEVTAAAATLPILMMEQGYSREMEREADRLGTLRLARARLSPEALADALRRMHDLEDWQSEAGWLDSHPDIRTRIDDIERVLSEPRDP
ncbi:MAG: M48 family metallopeptidase [Geminicoccaceae bacterium]